MLKLHILSVLTLILLLLLLIMIFFVKISYQFYYRIMTDMSKIVISVCTYRRAEQLYLYTKILECRVNDSSLYTHCHRMFLYNEGG